MTMRRTKINTEIIYFRANSTSMECSFSEREFKKTPRGFNSFRLIFSVCDDRFIITSHGLFFYNIQRHNKNSNKFMTVTSCSGFVRGKVQEYLSERSQQERK